MACGLCCAACSGRYLSVRRTLHPDRPTTMPCWPSSCFPLALSAASVVSRPGSRGSSSIRPRTSPKFLFCSPTANAGCKDHAHFLLRRAETLTTRFTIGAALSPKPLLIATPDCPGKNEMRWFAHLNLASKFHDTLSFLNFGFLCVDQDTVLSATRWTLRVTTSLQHRN